MARKQPDKDTSAVKVAAIAALATVAVAVITGIFALLQRPNPTPTTPQPTATSPSQTNAYFDYSVKVLAKEIELPIPNAKVTIEIISQAPLGELTDSDGIARFFIDTGQVGQPARLIVQATGFRLHKQNIDLRQGVLPVVVQIEQAATVPTPTATATPIPPTATVTPTPPTATVTFKKFIVKADDGWQDTGIVTSVEGKLTITYLSGTWSNCPAFGCPYVDASGVRDKEGCINCPDNVLLNCSHAALIAMVNDIVYCVGNNLSVVITQSGSLRLRINDKVLNDNRGSITVSITVE